MALTKTPICNFGEKAKDFNLKSVENKQISLNDMLLSFLLGGFMSAFVNCCFVFAARYMVAAEATLFFFLERSIFELDR